MKYNEEMGRRIKSLRERQKDMSIREAARRMKMDAGYLSRIEKGYIPSMQRLKTICDFYDIDLSYVMGEEIEPTNEMKSLMNKWLGFVKESERKGYTPEELEKIVRTIEEIKGITDKK